VTTGERAIAVVRDMSIILALWAIAVVVLIFAKNYSDAVNPKPAYCAAEGIRSAAPECD
jgi:hypothetical protein